MDWNSTLKINKLLTIIFLSAAMIFVGSFTTVVAEEEPGDAMEKAADVYNKNKSNERYQVVCNREAPVGSRIKKKVCRTVASTEIQQRETSRALKQRRIGVGNQQ